MCWEERVSYMFCAAGICVDHPDSATVACDQE
jgi:hypothetical protein